MPLRPIPRQLPARPFTTAEARTAGLTDRMLADVRFDRIVHGVHDLTTPAVLVERDRVCRLLRAVQRARPDTVASCLAAATLYDLPVPTRRIDVHVSAGTLLRRPEVIAHRWISDRDREVDGVCLTSPIQTFLDLAAELRPPWLFVIGDALVQHGRLSIDELLAAARSAQPRPGVRNARQIAQLVRLGSESPMESLLRLAIVEADLPEPVANGPAFDRPALGSPASTSATRRCASPSSTRATTTAPTYVSGGATSRAREPCRPPAGL